MATIAFDRDSSRDPFKTGALAGADKTLAATPVTAGHAIDVPLMAA